MTLRRYPWDEWLDGRYHTLVAGTDYFAARKTFDQLARRAAAYRHGRVHLTHTDTPTGERGVILHFYSILPKET